MRRLSRTAAPERETQDAVGAVRVEAVVLDGDGHGVESGRRPQKLQGPAQAAGVEVAAAHRGDLLRREAFEQLRRGSVADHARPEGADLVEIVGERERRLLAGHEGVAGAQMSLHGGAVGAAASWSGP